MEENPLVNTIQRKKNVDCRVQEALHYEILEFDQKDEEFPRQKGKVIISELLANGGEVFAAGDRNPR